MTDDASRLIAALVDAAEPVGAGDDARPHAPAGGSEPPDDVPPLHEGDGACIPATPSGELTDRADVIADCAKLDHSDTDNGRRLINHFGEDLLVLAYENVRNSDYVVWSGTHWDMRSGADAALKRAQDIGALIRAEAQYLQHTPDEKKALENEDANPKDAKDAREALEGRKVSRIKFGVSSKNKSRLDNMLVCAAPHLTRPPDAWNAHALRFATLTHTVTFRREGDGANFEALQGHDRTHLISRAVPVKYDRDAQCPKWRAFLDEFLPNNGVRKFVQVFSGLGLTGLPIQKLIYHYGTGANGKSVFLEVLTRVFGELAVTLQSETVTGIAERSAQQASPDLARLYGRWMVRVPELPQDEPIREALVKKLTGGEAIPARNLFKGQFDFIPLAKAHMSGNGFPRIDGTDNGIWRRMAVVHWPVTLEVARQRNFAEVVAEFMEEASGILNWLIDGALIYLADGLDEPEDVRAATQDYRDEMDPVGKFVEACVEPYPGGTVTGREMYNAYKAWSEASGMKPRTETAFGRTMKTKVKREDLRVRLYMDVRLKDVPYVPRNPDEGSW